MNKKLFMRPTIELSYLSTLVIATSGDDWGTAGEGGGILNAPEFLYEADLELL